MLSVQCRLSSISWNFWCENMMRAVTIDKHKAEIVPKDLPTKVVKNMK